MEFYDIEKHIAPKIVESGRCLYQKGAVRYLQKSTDSSWDVDILDGKTYEAYLVFKTRNMKELKLYRCNCEDQPQILCPHITAALFKIKDGLEMMAKYKENASVILQELDETEYPDAEGFKNIIHSALSEIWNREGEIDYFHTPVVLNIMQTLYSEAKSRYRKEEFSVCIDIISAIYEAIIPVYDLIIDEDFEIAGFLSEVQWLLEKIGIFSLNKEHVERIYYLILDTIDKADVDFLINLRLELLQIADILRNSEMMSKRMLDCMGKIMRDYVHRDILETSLKPVLFIKWQVLKSLRRFKEANELFDENQHWPIFTREALKRTFDLGDHQGVLDIIEESRKSADTTRYSSYTVNWQAWKIKAYKSANDIKQLRELYNRMLLEGDLSIYSDWKNTYSSEEWSKERDGFLDNLWANFPLAQQLMDIYQREEQFSKLTQDANQGTTRLPTALMNEVITFFCDYIDYLAKKAGNFKQYTEVIDEIRIFYTNSNHDWILELIELLKKNHRNGEFVEMLREFKEEILKQA